LSNKNEIKVQVELLSKVTAKSLVNRILSKHGVSRSNVKKPSGTERAELKKLLKDLKVQSDSFMKKL
jgi:SMC interacting uncharacterized protein involved in chromosome segregation